MTAPPVVLVIVLVLVLETTQPPPLDRQPFEPAVPPAEHESSTSPISEQPQTAEVAPKQRALRRTRASLAAPPVVLVIVLVLVLETTNHALDRQPFEPAVPPAEHESSTSTSSEQLQTAEVAPRTTPPKSTPADPRTPCPPSCSCSCSCSKPINHALDRQPFEHEHVHEHEHERGGGGCQMGT